MSSQFKSTWWQTEVPQEWNIIEDEVCVTFQMQRSTAVIQVSSAKKESDLVTTSDLREFAGEKINNKKTKSTKLAKFDGIYVEYFSGNRFWKEFWLKHANLLLYITYNTEKKMKDVERVSIEKFLNAIEPL